MRRVLLVDDDPAMGAAFCRTVEPFAFETDVACCASEALTLARTRRYPIVVANMRLHGLGGFALVEQLTRESDTPSFVLITGDRDVHVPSDHRFDRHIVSILSTPWDPDELVATLNRASELNARRSSLAPPHSGPRAAELSVLLVEDDDGDAYLVQEQLQRVRGPAVTRAACLGQALELLVQREFDVVVTDLSLPDARGLDTVMRLTEQRPSAAIVVWTGLDDEALSLQLVESGAQECLVKGSLDGAALVRALRQARERQRHTARLSRLARTDKVTGLANRYGFDERIAQALNRARRRAGGLAVMFIDLDGFKAVNDRLGHCAGDALLQQVAARLSLAVRGYDAVARLGGDEFAILIDDIDSASVADDFADRIVSLFAHPLSLAGDSQRLSVSVGVALYPRSGDTALQLIDAADRAMYTAKRAGGDRFCVSGSDARLPRSLSVRGS